MRLRGFKCSRRWLRIGYVLELFKDSRKEIGYVLGLNRDNGKEHGNYYIIMGYILRFVGSGFWGGFQVDGRSESGPCQLEGLWEVTGFLA